MSDQRPIARMLEYMGTKMETHEIIYSVAGENGGRIWKSEFAKLEHDRMSDIFKTLTLVEAFEPDFKAILKRKMPQRNGARR